MIPVWVVEYSVTQAAFHIDTLDRVLELNRQTSKQGLSTGFAPLHIAATSEEAHTFAEKWRREHL